MLRSKNMVRQVVSEVEFTTDCRNGRIEYASFGDGVYGRLVSNMEKMSNFLLEAEVLILWILSSFGSKDAFIDLWTHLSRMVKSGLRRLAGAGKFSSDDVSDVIYDVYMILVGENKRSKPYDHRKGQLSTWVDFRCRKLISQKVWKNRHISGLDHVLSECGLESIGDEDNGLVFEPSDPDTIGRKTDKWEDIGRLDDLKVESYERRESIDHALQIGKLAEKVGKENWNLLRLYFVDTKKKGDKEVPLTLADVAEKVGMTAMGVQKKLLRLINQIRYEKLGKIEETQPVLSLGGRKRQVKLRELEPRMFFPHEEGVLRVVDAPCSGYRHNGRTLRIPDRPQERLQSSISATISPTFADYVRKVKGKGFVMLVAD